jgi:hypothetical protein
MDEIARLIDLANQRLKAGRFGVKIEVQGKGGWMHLRGVFPPKLGEQRTKPYQTRVALKMRAINRESVKQAEMTAREIGLDLNLGRFDWRKFSDHEDGDPNHRTVAEWVEELERQFWQQRERNSSSENTWKKGYLSCFKLFPPDVELSTQLLIDWIIENSEPKTRRRG